MNILVLNTGSSSQKSCLYRIEGAALPENLAAPLWEGKIDWSHPAGPVLTVKSAAHPGSSLRKELSAVESPEDGLVRLLATLWSGEMAAVSGPDSIDAVGHRVVHGGREFEQPTPVTPEVKTAIRRMAPLSPEHNPAAVAGMEAIGKMLGSGTLQVAVFDTAFHGRMPAAAVVYPGPYAWVEQGIIRYGFHGINHAWCAERAALLLSDRDPATLRLITCHLGNGCSLAAVRGGRSVDTTMGFTPMEGLMMGSRSGSVDPGILLYLLRQPGATVEALDTLLHQDSGLQGLSGISEDMRAVLAARERGEERARLAFDVYIHRLRRSIGAMAASLGGVDALVFTAGVGENSPVVRATACADLGFLGLSLDEELNARAPSEPTERDVAAVESRVRVLIIPAQEDWAIARECWHLRRASDQARRQ